MIARIVKVIVPRHAPRRIVIGKLLNIDILVINAPLTGLLPMLARYDLSGARQSPAAERTTAFSP
jgi:hypothetical protein